MQGAVNKGPHFLKCASLPVNLVRKTHAITKMADHHIISTVLDKYFAFCREPGEEYSLAAPTEQIPVMMLDDSRAEDPYGYSF